MKCYPKFGASFQPHVFVHDAFLGFVFLKHTHTQKQRIFHVRMFAEFIIQPGL